MFFDVALSLSLLIFAAGVIGRVIGWFRVRPGDSPAGASATKRMSQAFSLAISVIFSPKIGQVLLDALFLRRLKARSRLRWGAHMLIFWGFIPLVLFHAMQGVVSENWLPDYYPTKSPYLFLRDLCLLMVLAGVALAIWRRKAEPNQEKTSSPMDAVTLVLVGAIMVSGLCLQAAKTISEPVFNEMVEEYAGLGQGPELTGLKALWQQDYSVAFSPEVKVDPEALELGRQANEESCLDCHSRPSEAFLSYGLAQVFKPMAAAFAGARLDRAFWYIHILLCFAGLAWLPFGKMLHVLTAPLSLAAASVREQGPAPEEPGQAARRGLDLDACTHCGLCSQHCSVKDLLGLYPDAEILPSEKLAAMRALTRASTPDPETARLLRRANDLCTRCNRCTELCPVGINLQDLWFDLARRLDESGVESEYQTVRDAKIEVTNLFMAEDEPLKLEPAKIMNSGLSADAESFKYCYQCRTCTASCPVVAKFDAEGKDIGLRPHQIMHSLRLGLGYWAMGAKMTWECMTCYQCQEACPQGVHVTDLLYELRNMAHAADSSPDAGQKAGMGG